MESFIQVCDDLFDSSKFINLINEKDIFNKTNLNGIEIKYISHMLHDDNLNIKDKWLEISNPLNQKIIEYRDKNKIVFNESDGFCLVKNFSVLNTHLHFGKMDYKNNIFGVIAFLNDDYDGGDVVFPFFNTKIKPKKGSAILFPASFPFSYSFESSESEDKKDRFYIINWYYLSSANHNMIDHTSILTEEVI